MSWIKTEMQGFTRHIDEEGRGHIDEAGPAHFVATKIVDASAEQKAEQKALLEARSSATKNPRLAKHLRERIKAIDTLKTAERSGPHPTLQAAQKVF